MLALVIVLAGTTVLALVALAVVVARPPSWLVERTLAVDQRAAAALDRTPRPPAVTGAVRRLISIEILNVRELVATRGKLAGLAGSLAPALTRRIVYDQTLKILNEQLAAQRVRADVRLHVIPPTGTGDSVDQLPV